MVTRLNSRAHQADDSYDFSVPWAIADADGADQAADTEQHKKRHGHHLRKRSIRHYRHATTKWGAVLESFQPIWFAIAISTGGLAIILNGPFPYPAVWQVTLASVLYVFEIVLFVVFSVLSIARWIIYPHVAVRRALADPDELGAYAIPPIALMTIAALTASQVSEAGWGGHSFTLVAYVLWWIGVVWIFLTALVVITVFIYTGNQMDRVMTPVLFMAPVGLATAGVEAGFITIFGAGMSSRLAVPMLIVGYFAVGVAFFMAIILYTIFFHRLLAAGWGPAAKRGALFILVSTTPSTCS
jgi:tellurite resistance protein TehA-like permease